MRRILLASAALVCVALFARAALAQVDNSRRPAAPPAEEARRAEVLVLGVYHMANPGRDIFNVQADDVLTPKRQREIAELAEALKRFRPTKIAVEADYGTDAVPKRYAEYVAGKHELTRNEIEQVGFRLAKELGHKSVYPVDADGDFPYQRVVNYAKATGQSARLEALMRDTWGEMSKAQGEYLKAHTVLETMLYVNSDARVARDVGAYYQLARYGEPGDYAGPDLLAEWYRRNARIYSNVMKLVETPEDRVLVIFGYGHLGWLRQDVASDPTLRLRRLDEFATAAADR
ncbi:MAG TPA: DUF5694 domain-containing protein [Pyrinomonadaceae bacterium]|jgi:hypothetical protein|nr:DUF5694 domain-containing protein [Pyrinomonadaceae bacterium]